MNGNERGMRRLFGVKERYLEAVSSEDLQNTYSGYQK